MSKDKVVVKVSIRVELLEELYKLCQGDMTKVQQQLSNDLDFIYRYMRSDRGQEMNGEKLDDAKLSK